MLQNEEIIDIEPIQTQVIICPKCGQKNRIYNKPKVRFRCGTCKHLLNPNTPISRASSVVSNLRLGRFFSSKPFLVSLSVIIGVTVLTGLAMLGSGSSGSNPRPLPEEPIRQIGPPTPTPTNIIPAPAYVRPPSDPYGHPWPTIAGYIKGSKKSNTRGYSTVTVDNQENDSDVHVKLIALITSGDKCVREFYIPARSKFTVSRVSSGIYEIWCSLLNSGSLSRTDSFHLDETRTNESINSTMFRLTLYKVPNGNMNTYPISPNEFYNVPTSSEDEVPNHAFNSDATSASKRSP